MNISQLQKANQDFVSQSTDEKKLRHELFKNGQAPKTIVLSCADSRVPVEQIFKAKVGDLFVCRVAGNFLTDEVMASIEFALLNFNSSEILVLGHRCCGALDALTNYLAKKLDPPTPHLKTLLVNLSKDLQNDFSTLGEEKFKEQSIRLNVEKNCQALSEKSALVRERLAKKMLNIHGGIYDIESGLVKFL